jgi:branched-chain amino acid aminotransferase
MTEGRGWNIFVVKAGTLTTPDRGILEGITRKTVIELSAKLNIKAHIGPCSGPFLKSADEVFITSTAGGIIPVRSVDRQMIGDGGPGPVTMRLKRMYRELLENPDYTTPVHYEVGSDVATTARSFNDPIGGA